MKRTTLTVSTAFILIVATLLNIDQLYAMAGMLAALPLVCYFVGRRQNGGLRDRSPRHLSVPSRASRDGGAVGLPFDRRAALGLPTRRQPVRRQLPAHGGDARRGL